MKPLTIGLIDYGMGNHASVIHSLRELEFRVRTSDDPEVLDSTDILLLPGVGAFPPAMRELHRRGLTDYLRRQASARRPIVGICLGMQLLTTASWEHEYTTGLDLVPGEIVHFEDGGWHIGWNTVRVVPADEMLQPSDGQVLYFNHSLHYRGPPQYQVAHTSHAAPFASIIRNGNVVGLQFHPEKSQLAGRLLLRNLMESLASA